ncbi:MAG: hypothetical protein ABSC45_04600 [Desulfobaccales bacterium]|jgi:hypothetical protein
MSWLRLAVLAFLITIFIFAGVASGQGSYELQGQGLQPLQNGLPEQGPQLLQDLPGHKRPSLCGPGSTNDVSSPKAKFQQAAPRAAGIRKTAKGTNAKGYSSGPDSFGPATGHNGMRPASGPQINAPPKGLFGMGNNQGSSPGQASFLDGYFLNSLHGGGLPAENRQGEETPEND